MRPFHRYLRAPVAVLIRVSWGGACTDELTEQTRREIGWGWKTHPHGTTLANDVLGQLANGDPSRPHFGSHGPYGGATAHGLFFHAFNSGRYQTVGGLAAHVGTGKLAVPDYWNHRVLLFDLAPDGALVSRGATGLIGQKRFDEMGIDQGREGLHFPSACAFTPTGDVLFVADEYNHRVLQFDLTAPGRAMRVYGRRTSTRGALTRRQGTCCGTPLATMSAGRRSSDARTRAGSTCHAVSRRTASASLSPTATTIGSWSSRPPGPRRSPFWDSPTSRAGSPTGVDTAVRTRCSFPAAWRSTAACHASWSPMA